MADEINYLAQMPDYLRPPERKPFITEPAECWHKALRHTLRITAQPIVPHLRERAEELRAHPDPSHPDVQEDCKNVTLAIIERRHTRLGHQEWAEHHRKTGNHEQAEIHEKHLKRYG
jgi:hypothetical protein